MRREEYQQKALAQRLAGFKKVYEKAGKSYLDSLDSEQILSELGYWGVRIEDEVLSYVSDEWHDIKELLTTYPLAPEIRGYKREVLQPLEKEIEETFRAWWKRMHRLTHLDFKNIPASPLNQDMTPKKINQRTYQVGQLRLCFDGSKGERQCSIYAGSTLLWQFQTPVDLRELPTYIPLHLTSRLKAVSRLCDWSQLAQLSSAQKQALARRLNVVKHFYQAAARK